MTLGQQWVRRPQGLWLRKAVFQVHLWTGIGVGLYVVLICVSGSVLVYRSELFRAFTSPPLILSGSGNRMPLEALKKAAERAYPGYHVTQVWKGKNPDEAVEIWLQRGQGKKLRLFHPYTGEDLGNSMRVGYRFVSWLLELHDDLLLGRTGRPLNAVGGLFVTLLSLTGAVIWWPGIKAWRRGLTIRWKTSWRRLNWDLHSALGFWTVVLIFMWGISGVYLAFPQPFMAAVDFLEPLDELRPQRRLGDTVLLWVARVHFGRFGGWPVKVLWVVLGLGPPLLFVTGALMWWNRVLRHGPRQPD